MFKEGREKGNCKGLKVEACLVYPRNIAQTTWLEFCKPGEK